MSTDAPEHTLTMDIAKYTSSDPEGLLRLHPAMVQALQRHFAGFVGARLAYLADGSWIDIVTWASAAAAADAIAGEAAIAEYAAYVAHIDAVHWSETATVASLSTGTTPP